MSTQETEPRLPDDIDTIDDAFAELRDRYDGRYRAEMHRLMYAVLDEFDSDEIAEYLVAEAGDCPVCGHDIDTDNVQNLIDLGGYNDPDHTPAPFIECANDCIEPLDRNITMNRWITLRDAWMADDLEAEARKAVAGLVRDHALDIKRVYTTGDTADLGLTDAEQEAIHDRLDEVVRIVDSPKGDLPSDD